MACTLGCFSFLSYFHIKPYLIQTHVAFKVLRKKMPRCGLATPRRNSTRVLDVMLVTTPTTMFLIVELFEKMQSTGFWNIQHKDFLELIAPSFTGVEDAEDMAAILARTHGHRLDRERGVLPCCKHWEGAMSISSLGRIRRWRTSWLLSTNRSSRLTRQILKLMFFLKDIMQTLSGPSCFANFFEGNQLPETITVRQRGLARDARSSTSSSHSRICIASEAWKGQPRLEALEALPCHHRHWARFSFSCKKGSAFSACIIFAILACHAFLSCHESWKCWVGLAWTWGAGSNRFREWHGELHGWDRWYATCGRGSWWGLVDWWEKTSSILKLCLWTAASFEDHWIGQEIETRLNYTSRSCRVACPCVDTSSYDEKDEQYVLLCCLHGRCHSRSVTFASTCTSDYIP